MVDLSLLVGIPVLVVGASMVSYALALRSRFHYTSALSCPKCGEAFEYDWVPGASFSALRLGRERYLRCPMCHEWSTFDVMATRAKKQSSQGPSAVANQN